MDTMDVLYEVCQELQRAKAKFGDFHSAHEGAAVIREEFDEFWDAVKANDLVQARHEAVQVAAMACRFIEDLEGPK